jgi:asparagine synthase (glutamine-hydrolysing)
LSGDGGDETFLGYQSYVGASARRYRKGIPAPIRTFIGEVGERLPERSPGKRYLQSFGVADPRYHCVGVSEQWKRKLFSQEFMQTVPGVNTMSVYDRHLQNKHMSAVTTCGYLDTKVYLPENVLVKVDRMSMANSLEARTLFLDHEIVEFAARIPWHLKLRGKTGKYILKRAVADLLPPETLNRRKSGFALPTAVWLRGPLRELMRDSVASAAKQGIFNSSYLDRLLTDHDAGVADNQRVLWALLMFERWMNECAVPKRVCSWSQA